MKPVGKRILERASITVSDSELLVCLADFATEMGHPQVGLRLLRISALLKESGA